MYALYWWCRTQGQKFGLRKWKGEGLVWSEWKGIEMIALEEYQTRRIGVHQGVSPETGT